MHNIIKHSGQLQCCIGPTVRDETNNAENVWKKSTAFIHSVMRTCEHTHVLYFTSKYVVVIAADL